MKGKFYEERFGKEKAYKIKQKLKNSCIGKNKGKISKNKNKPGDSYRKKT